MPYSEENIVSYTIDYRSPPSGLGVVDYHGKKILIMLQGPRTMKEVANYSSISILNSGDDYDLKAHNLVMDTLRRYRVTTVYDSELAGETDNHDNGSFDLNTWDQTVRSFF